MQVFRLMGMPDKVIAFDELPPQYLEGLELCDCTKFGRAWRDFIGISQKKINIPPEKNKITGIWETYQPLVLEGPFAYQIDWEINSNKERWAEIVSYVRRNGPTSWKQPLMENGVVKEETVRMMDDLEKMAKPLAVDVHRELSLEPEEVYIIPLSKVAAPEEPTAAVVIPAKQTDFVCQDCGKVFAAKQGLLLHRIKKHPKVKATA